MTPKPPDFALRTKPSEILEKSDNTATARTYNQSPEYAARASLCVDDESIASDETTTDERVIASESLAILAALAPPSTLMC